MDPTPPPAENPSEGQHHERPDKRSVPLRRASRSASPPNPGGPSPGARHRPAQPESSPLSEFEDEAPGAYLAELQVRRWNWIWALSNALVTAMLAGLRWSSGLAMAPSSSAPQGGEEILWEKPATLLWNLIPVSVGVLVVVTLWQVFNRYSASRGPAAAVTLILSLLTYTSWRVFNAYGLGFAR